MGLKRRFSKGVIEAGCDEAGRGCLAGPVFAAAVILPDRFRLPEVDDSKKLTAAVRDELRIQIEKKALAWAVARVDHEEIDTINILWASVKAMHLALDQLATRPELILIDGNRFKAYNNTPYQCVVGGDGLYASIAAASILAKTHRDEYMQSLHLEFPHYGWDVNKGYGTPIHREAIKVHGISPYHRKSFRMGQEEMTGDLFAGVVAE
jgi:ribonuclease HII